jgi:hypothetical protein
MVSLLASVKGAATMADVDTARWQEANKGRKPSGEHYWRFRSGNVIIERDGPFPEARDSALKAFRRWNGKSPDLMVELLPARVD